LAAVKRRALAVSVFLLLGIFPAASYGARYIIHVTTPVDEFDTAGSGIGCSLREAIRTANDSANFGGCARVLAAGFGADTVVLPAGTFTLSLMGAGEDLDATGDLDIRTSMTISTSATTPPTVTASKNFDRIFDVLSGVVAINGLGIDGGTADEGGGVRVATGATVRLTSDQVANNGAVGAGGGGGIFLTDGATATLTDVSVTHNYANGGSAVVGGGIRAGGASLTLVDSTISDNSAWYGGAGISTAGILTIRNSTISGNRVPCCDEYGGGGIYSAGGTVSLRDVTLSDNTVYGTGGALLLHLGTATLTNVTIGRNTATSSGVLSVSGGGLWSDAGALTLTNVTVAGNTAPTAGGIASPASSVRLVNTLLADNTGGNCVLRSLSPAFTGGGDLSSDATCGFAPGRQGVNPRLTPLGTFGGATETFALPANSPAIDFGTRVGCPGFDQRGVARPVGSLCDVGATESRARIKVIANGSFETYPTRSARVPKKWTAHHIGRRDGKTRSRKAGRYALRLTGARNATKTISQRITAHGAAGDAFAFSLWEKGTRIPTSGLCQAAITFYSGTHALETTPVPCSTGTFAWQRASATAIAPARYSSIVVAFTYREPSGTLFLDGAGLSRY
jgi:CSLREA domain-containing protein